MVCQHNGSGLVSKLKIDQIGPSKTQLHFHRRPCLLHDIIYSAMSLINADPSGVLRPQLACKHDQDKIKIVRF